MCRIIWTLRFACQVDAEGKTLVKGDYLRQIVKMKK
jgi:hypothetical protein